MPASRQRSCMDVQFVRSINPVRTLQLKDEILGLLCRRSELRINDLTTGDNHNRLAHDCACDVICAAGDVCRELKTILHCSAVVSRFSSASEGSRVCMVHASIRGSGPDVLHSSLGPFAMTIEKAKALLHI